MLLAAGCGCGPRKNAFLCVLELFWNDWHFVELVCHLCCLTGNSSRVVEWSEVICLHLALFFGLRKISYILLHASVFVNSHGWIWGKVQPLCLWLLLGSFMHSIRASSSLPSFMAFPHRRLCNRMNETYILWSLNNKCGKRHKILWSSSHFSQSEEGIHCFQYVQVASQLEVLINPEKRNVNAS